MLELRFFEKATQFEKKIFSWSKPSEKTSILAFAGSPK